MADFIFGKIHLKNNKNNLKIHINNKESKNITNLKLLDAFECVEVKRWNFRITYSVWWECVSPPPYRPRFPFDCVGWNKALLLGRWIQMTDMKNRVMGSENKWEKKRKERNNEKKEKRERKEKRKENFPEN